MDSLAGKTALVTGAGSGIGLGIARQLARAGVSVALADIRGDAAESAAAEVVAAGGRAIPLTIDVSDRADVERAADAVEGAFGRLHIAVNNAGVAMHGVPIEEIAPADWDWVIGVNIYGVIHGIQTFVPRITTSSIRRRSAGCRSIRTSTRARIR
jgi:NAD(P)-dependent dehydrogenase (short-subunit alcohol dehydrogenase family)